LIGVAEKTPTPPGPPCEELLALGAFVTAPGDELVPVDNSVVDVADDGALVDAPVPVPLVVETASCARNVSDKPTIDINASNKMDSRLILVGAPTRSSLGWSKKRATALS
jgi:hypothetical protein